VFHLCHRFSLQQTGRQIEEPCGKLQGMRSLLRFTESLAAQKSTTFAVKRSLSEAGIISV
jgi:hypothetical protein